MECQDNLVSEASLYNNFKIYKHAQVVDYPGQKMLKIKMENKNIQHDDWYAIEPENNDLFQKETSC